VCVFCWNLVTVDMLGLLQHVRCVFMPKMCVVCSELTFTVELCVQHRINIRCKNYVGCSELTFAVELCVLQQNCDSLPKLCRLQRITIRCQN